MLKTISPLLLLVIFSSSTYCQNLDKYEFWGWEGTKEEFAQIYQDATGKDLRQGYVCMGDSCHVDSLDEVFYSTILNNIEGFMSGNLDWSTTERLVILKNTEDKIWTSRSPDSTEVIAIKSLLQTLENKDSIELGNYLQNHKSDFYTIIYGTFSEDLSIHMDCINVLERMAKLNFKANNKDLEILADMLSFPSPESCYLAIEIIKNSNLPNRNKISRKLFSQKASTLVNFLNSNLQSYQSDAVAFLKELYPNRGHSTAIEWVDWINSFTKG